MVNNLYSTIKIGVDMQGGPNWVGNWVDAPIVINKDADEFYKQPIFYFMAHFRFVVLALKLIIDTRL